MAITENGYVVTSEEEYYDYIIEELKNQFPSMSDSPSNLLTILARIMAKNENKRDYDTVLRYSYAYIATATGVHLSKAVRTGGVSRILGINAVGNVELTKDTGTAQVLIPPKTLLKSGELIYETTNASTLIINTATEIIQVKSTETGIAYNIPNGSTFKTVENVSGIESIIGVTEIEGGGEEETDSELRARYYDRISGFSNSSLSGVVEKVESLQDVTKASGIENNTDAPVGGLLPHSFIIYASGGTDQEVADAIVESKPAGIQTNGDVTVNVDVYGTLYPIKFSRFVNQTVYYDIEVVVDPTTVPIDFEDLLKTLIIDYTAPATVIKAYELTNFISQNLESVRGVSQLYFGLTPNPTTSVDLVADVGKILFATDLTIDVAVI